MSEPALLSDETLLAAIERAARLEVGPADVEHEVGQRAWVNTIRSAERFALNTANIEPEEGKKLPALREARDVVYWGRPIDTHDPRIAGIVWHQNGSTEVFFGILYPP
jgi:hypothetical protein